MMASQRVAVVTGSNRGIGFAIVRALCKQLDNGIVYLTARNEVSGNEAVARLKQEGLQPKFHQLDINDNASINRLRDYLKETYGGVDVLVNNAGVAFKNASTEPFANQVSITMATNYLATLAVCRTFIPVLKPHGRIVNMASEVGRYSYEKMSKEVQARFQAVKTEEDVNLLMKEFEEAAKDGNHESKGWPSLAYRTVQVGLICGTKTLAQTLQTERSEDDLLLMTCCPGYVMTDMSSHKGTKTPDEGADTPVYLALLSPGSKEFNGNLYLDRTLVDFISSGAGL